MRLERLCVCATFVCALALAPAATAQSPRERLATAVEYYNVARDHYFITASEAEIAALDSGSFEGWQRSGETFPVGAKEVTRLNGEYTYAGHAVCRYYMPPAQGDSHFFSASRDECAAVGARFGSFVLETDAAFYAALPDPATGRCGAMEGFIDGDIELVPVYRLWNRRADTNHRYTTRLSDRAAMLARGWEPEGYGPLGVAMCVSAAGS